MIKLNLTKKMLLSIVLLFNISVFSAEVKKNKKKQNQQIQNKKVLLIKNTNSTVQRLPATEAKKNNVKVYSNSKNSALRNQVSQALTYYKNGEYAQAAMLFHSLSKRSDLTNERTQIKLYLGDSLAELNLNQTAAFQYVDVIKSGDAKLTKSAIEKLLIVTDKLGDETLLNYAIQRIDVESVPQKNRDMLFYRMGDIKLNNREFNAAISLLEKVGPQSRYYYNALYSLGLAYAELKDTQQALRSFNKLLAVKEKSKVTDTTRVAAQMGVARVLYQKKDFDAAIDAYNLIPRDHRLWHDALFEKSWAMLRSARFRSVLSNLHSLHSSYYEDFYLPESLLLRSIVYLYICKYDEMEKVIELYDKEYVPLLARVDDFLNTRIAALDYYQEIEKINSYKNSDKNIPNMKLPFKVVYKISQEGDVRRDISYIKRLMEEKKQVEESGSFRASPVGAYSLKVLTNRLKGAKQHTGDLVKAHLENMVIEMKDLQEQASLIKYEMINGQKESIKKRIEGKNLDDVLVDEDQDRSFYIQNGYEYYPFQGEYWLDEVGNSHYLGKQSCE